MQLTRVPTDAPEDVVRQWWDLLVAAQRVDDPGLPANTWRGTVAGIRTPLPDQEAQLWLSADGRAGYRLTLPLRENRDLGALRELVVHPDRRRHRIGRALLDHASSQALAAGRCRLVGEAVQPLDAASAGPRFAAAVGAREALVDVRRVLDLDRVDPALHGRLRTEAEPHAVGYQLVSWRWPTPDALVDEVAHCMARMSVDAPWDDLAWEPEVWDAARVRAAEERAAAEGRVVLVTAAVHAASGRIAAYTELAVAPEQPTEGHQWNTIVLGEHRGHRLGLLTKLANHDRLPAASPATRRLHTYNAASNQHMVAVNDALGYVPDARVGEWELRLAT